MVGKLVTPILGLFFSVMSGFVVISVLVYFGNGGGAAGAAAVRGVTGQATGLATVLIRGVVDLAQAIFSAVVGAIQ